MLLVIGIDLSLCNTGYVELVDGKLERKKLIKSKPTDKTPFAETERLHTILSEISQLIKENIIRPSGCSDRSSIDLVVIEGLAYMARNTSALVQLAGLHFLLRDWLYNESFPFVVVAPTTLKKFITGRGNSPKDLMMMETYKRYGVTLSNDNQCDAYALAKVGQALLDKELKLTKFQQEVVKLLNIQL